MTAIIIVIRISFRYRHARQPIFLLRSASFHFRLSRQNGDATSRYYHGLIHLWATKSRFVKDAAYHWRSLGHFRLELGIFRHYATTTLQRYIFAPYDNIFFCSPISPLWCKRHARMAYFRRFHISYDTYGPDKFPPGLGLIYRLKFLPCLAGR